MAVNLASTRRLASACFGHRALRAECRVACLRPAWNLVTRCATAARQVNQVSARVPGRTASRALCVPPPS